MSAIQMDGRAVANQWKSQIALEAQKLISSGIEPHLAVVLVGENPASQVYVRNKENGCIKAGIRSTVIRMDENCTQQELEEMRAQDPVPHFASYLLQVGAATEADLAQLEKQVAEVVNEATDYAEQAPFAPPEHALRFVYEEADA